MSEPRSEKTHFAANAEERGEGICRTCLAPIYRERTERGAGLLPRVGWSDRHRSDPLVCFKARDYDHVPLSGREAAIYDAALVRLPPASEVRDD